MAAVFLGPGTEVKVVLFLQSVWSEYKEKEPSVPQADALLSSASPWEQEWDTTVIPRMVGAARTDVQVAELDFARQGKLCCICAFFFAVRQGHAFVRKVL